MVSSNIGRRPLLTGVGTAFATAVAGCLGGSDDDAEEDETVVDEATATEGDTDPDAWRDVSEIRLRGYVGGWVGLSPPQIELVENPTLVLVDGQAYDLTWQNADGVHHNVTLWNDDEEVVDGYSTDGTDEEGATETLTFEAAPEMETYVCEYQRAIQFGDIEVLGR